MPVPVTPSLVVTIANARWNQLIPHGLEIGYQPRLMLHRGDPGSRPHGEYRDNPISDSGPVNLLRHLPRDVHDVTVAGCLQTQRPALHHRNRLHLEDIR